MPRWKALPDELDPQVREFATQLRRLVDRSGLSVAALSDRTGYSRTSWERYLGGRLLAPKGAVVALAEVTGSNPVHLTTMWELAERAWSRSEQRHDMTMEAIRISQARAALGEFGAPPSASTTAAGTGAAAGAGTGGGGGGGAEAGSGSGGKAARRAAGAVAMPGIAGPAGVSPTIPPQPTAPDANRREGSGSRGPAAPRGGPAAPGGGKRRLTMFLAGIVGMVVVIAAVLFLTGNDDGGKKNQGAASASPSVGTGTDLPAGVKCAGAGCTGKDAEAMGCSGDLVTTAKTATVGATTLEVRYSRTCGAAWGRITGAARGDSVRITAGTTTERGDITATGDTIAYTPMVAVKDATGAKACATLASGRTGCTT
ncbi:helix-turn-helix protein [Streptomyces sp. Ag109_O5-1]|uniref:helix-turn-helix domain-containing protein n=1 Tax=Streptomyces sp. Ag109_O5-1 TaxID=1938851 RepID=UPI000F4E52DF|nr:XRE family transcriptional regulator [Streptomyces sp. Ag109_O5-1]RPE41351.1 helix-turn-helix protein [Streptomyces sp. Ag109_O5-1]